jgi:hypothetical protein
MNTNAAIATIARAIARQAVKQDLWDQGRKLIDFRASELSARAHDWLRQHPEVFDEAAERVRTNPRLRALARKA